MGLAPIAGAQLHVLLYLANTLAPLLKITAARGRVLKRGNYPFYPDVQHEVDVLSYSGILIVERVQYGRRGHLAAEYGLGRMGAHTLELLLAADPEMERLARLFRELLSACFGKFLATQVDIGPIDANYGNDSILPGEVVDFSEWTSENQNLAVARYLLNELRALHPRAERDGIRLYCDYLDEALAVHE